MKLKVKYVGMTMGAHYHHGEMVMELPDTNFVDQYRSFCEQMTELASYREFFELDEEGMEIIEEE